MPAPEPSPFTLESPPAFAGPLGSAPVVGDRYVHRDTSAEIIKVTATHIELVVDTPTESFWKSVTLQEFPTLEQRTLKAGAVFKPAPNVCVSDGPADAPELIRSAEGPFAARNG